MSTQQEKDVNEKGRDEMFNIIVNGRLKIVATEELSFEQIVKLAFPNPPLGQSTIYTVTFKNADQKRSEGTLTPGQTVKVREEGTVFNVTETSQS